MTMGRRAHYRGSAKTWALIGIIGLLAVMVPIGLYIISTVSFSNGSSGTNLSAPDTGQTTAAPAANVAATPATATVNATPATPAGRAARQVANTVTGKTMDLLVIDADTKQPIPGMRVNVNGRIRFTGTTDATGHVPVSIPADTKNPGYFAIRVSGKGYLGKRLQWVPYDPQLREGEVPTSYTMAMEHGTKIHGTIVDDAGQPVEGANVVVEFNKKYANPHEQVDVPGFNRNKPLLSAADGTWSFNGAPVNCDEISLTAWDNHHVSEDFWNAQPFTPVSSLYDGTAKFVLQRGVTLDGTVTDPQGNPIAGASVGRGTERFASNVMPAVNTDSAGHFSYQFSPGQQVVLTVQARGFAPQMKELTMGNSKQTISVQLGKAHRIAGKIVDASGRPVRNAQIRVQSWLSHQTLEANFQTDSTGAFHWNEAPAEPVTVSVFAPGLRQMDEQTLTPDQDNTITVGKTSHIRGTVTDAATGQAIQHFHLILGIKWQGQDNVTWQPGWEPDLGTRAGSFNFENQWSYPGIAVRVTAQGYLPADSRIVLPNEGDVTLDLKMKPGKDLTFTVLSAEGTPVANATAVIATPGQQAQINNGRAMDYGTAAQAESGTDGKVDFPPQTGAFKIAVLADAGFAEFDQDALAKSNEIKLVHWGVIKGHMQKGSKPAVNEFVEVMSQDQQDFGDNDVPRIFKRTSVKTDANGDFVIDRLAPGKWELGRRVPLSANSWSQVMMADVDLAAGQTVNLTLGGTGRPVTGKVVLPESLAKQSDWVYGYSTIGKKNTMAIEGPNIPESVRTGPPEARRKWMQDWLKTDAGKKYREELREQQRNFRTFPITIAADGTFRADDVPPGDYTVNIDISKMVTNNRMQMQQPVGYGYAEFTMPEIPGGRSDDPLQLDPVQVSELKKYEAGDEIFNLPLKTTAGKLIKLSDFRGKYLLIDFFHPMDFSIPSFKSLSADYGHDDRLVMMTILPEMMAPGTTPMKLNDNPWIEAAVSAPGIGWAVLHTNFDTDNTKGAWFIGPDGKVIAENLVGDGIRAAVVSAIGAAQGGPPAAAAPATMPTTAP